MCGIVEEVKLGWELQCMLHYTALPHARAHTHTRMHAPPTHRSKDVAVSTGSLVVSLHPAVTRRHHNMAAAESLCLHLHPLNGYHPLHEHISRVCGRVEDHHVPPPNPPPPQAPPVHPRDVSTLRRRVERGLRCTEKESVASFRMLIRKIQESYTVPS